MIGTTELLLVAGLALLLFGGKKLPEMMKGMGQGVKSFKEGLNSPVDEPKKQDDIMDKIDNLKQDQKKALQEGRISDAASIAREIEQLYKKFNKIGLFSCLAICCLMFFGCKSEKVNQEFNTPLIIGERVRIVESGKTMKIPQLNPPAKKWYLVDDVGLCQWLNIPSSAQP